MPSCFTSTGIADIFNLFALYLAIETEKDVYVFHDNIIYQSKITNTVEEAKSNNLYIDLASKDPEMKRR